MAATDANVPPAISKSYKLNTGAEIPAFGFGCWQSEKGLVGEAVKIAVKNGCRHIDSASIYMNEKEVGQALHELFEEGVVDRESIWVTTKLWNTAHEPSRVEEAVRTQLKELKLSYADLILIHWPIAFKWPESGKHEEVGDFLPFGPEGGCEPIDVPLVETWKAMEALVDKGLVKNIGVSNYNAEQLKETFAAARIKPAVLQIEVQPALPNTELRALAKELGIVVEAYSPLGVGMKGIWSGVIHMPEFIAIAEKAKLTPAQLALTWNFQLGNVVLSKSTTPERIVQNVATPLGGLSDEIMSDIEAFGKKHAVRVGNPPIFKTKAGVLFFPPEANLPVDAPKEE